MMLTFNINDRQFCSIILEDFWLRDRAQLNDNPRSADVQLLTDSGNSCAAIEEGRMFQVDNGT